MTSTKIPKLRRWKKRDLAYVNYNRKKYYLGKWGSEEAKDAYVAFCANLDAPQDYNPTLADVALAFLEAKKNYYVKDGRQTSQLDRFKASLEYPLKLYPDLPAKDFGPKKLIICRSEMEKSGRFSRTYINTLVNCIRHVFKFAVEQELILPETLMALQAVAPLKRGRSVAREMAPVKPVPVDVVEKTMAELSSVVAGMVAVQRLTGMRPGEVCSMKVGDLFFDGDVLIYSPSTDKTDWRRAVGDLKRIPIGPKAQEIIVSFWGRKKKNEYIFQPKEAVEEFFEKKRSERRTPITKQTLERDAKPKKEYGPCFTVCSYARAITRAAKRAGVEKWSPNRLRHLYATEIRAKYGLEASQIMLGHSNANVTQIYAERDFKKAVEVAIAEG